MVTLDIIGLGISALERERERVEIVSIVDNMVESHFRWFGHVCRRAVGASIRRVDQMEGNTITRGRGKLKKIIDKTVNTC